MKNCRFETAFTKYRKTSVVKQRLPLPPVVFQKSDDEKVQKCSKQQTRQSFQNQIFQKVFDMLSGLQSIGIFCPLTYVSHDYYYKIYKRGPRDKVTLLSGKVDILSCNCLNEVTTNFQKLIFHNSCICLTPANEVIGGNLEKFWRHLFSDCFYPPAKYAHTLWGSC